ncbi:DUF2294 domain-containing protein [Peribacillus sp. SCS-155]|uniref:DUF2294 domain-containing protein n=1 Tax=Peribacillus sedimenti TaxID=3115297 RepID=UPI003905FC83
MENSKSEKELASFIARTLRENFGRGPDSVFVSITPPFVTVYFTNFLSPMEKTLLQKRGVVFVQETRDFLMETLIEEMKAYIKVNVGMEIQEFYYDWNLDSRSGMFVGISETTRTAFEASYSNQDKIHNEISNFTAEIQKRPDKIFSYLINPRTILIIREGIFISIEKELIQLGFHEQLRISKRNLEKRVLHQHRENFEKYLHAQLTDILVDWDFDRDKSSILFIFKPRT